MDLSEKMEGNLDNIRAGAVGFRVVGILSAVLGAILIGVAVLKTVGAAEPGLGVLLGNLGGVVNYFLVAWLAHRASDAFDAVAALILELREIV